VVDSLHDFDFAADGFLPLDIFHLLLFINLKSNFIVSFNAHAQEY
jgi:hypothetical protein